MLFEILIILSCLTLACSEEVRSCPECPHNSMPCHLQLNFREPCVCHVCLTICYTRASVCQKGEVCITEDVHFGNVYVGQTAVCVPFQQCPQIQCPAGCPESGYFVDDNDCPTCLCNDPCKELKCAEGCGMSGTYVGAEPKYRCRG